MLTFNPPEGTHRPADGWGEKGRSKERARRERLTEKGEGTYYHQG